jgi:D-lactate dehydrogenase (cytochrome)
VLTGEHGIGLGKIDYLAQEHSSSIGLMKQIKKMFDPYSIFNPGKIL